MPDVVRRSTPARQALFIALLLFVLCCLLAYLFTARSSAEEERARARLILQTIYRLEQVYFEEHAVYLPINGEDIGAILKLNDVPGRFRYRVEIGGPGFSAFAEADLDGDGDSEIWQVDQNTPNPVLKKGD